MAPRIVAVMGLTGAGKSSFIKLATGNANVKIGDNLDPETQEISSYKITINGLEHTLVDTPGFADKDRTDTEILKMLVDWLAKSYRAGQTLRGILYLYRIDETRLKGSSLRNLNMLKQLCGEDFYKYLTLGTTCWSLVDYSTGVSRETQLVNTMSFWKNMIDKGATRVHIPDSASEARDLVYRIANRGGSAPLKAQKEVVGQGLGFGDLQVTQVVKREIELEEAARARKNSLAMQKMLHELEMLAIREEQLRRAILAEEQARLNRMQHYVDITRYCRLKRPFGICDKAGCYNKLKRFRYIYHCCSCRDDDMYWYCGPCGNDCGNSEHPYMTQLDTGDCVIM